MELKQVIIAYKAGESQSKAWAEKYAGALEKRNCKVLMGPSGFKDNPYPVFLSSVSSQIDLALVFGGDGTALAAARELALEAPLILAVNVGGHLGFLTEPFELCQDIEATLDRLESDVYAIQRRMMLQAQVLEGGRIKPEPMSDRFFCLNEMCVKPASIDRMPTSILEMEVDGEVVDQFQGDGLIVSTPTGSTCYTASANGPIVHPGMEAMVVTPILSAKSFQSPFSHSPGFCGQCLATGRTRTRHQTLDRWIIRNHDLARATSIGHHGKLFSQVYYPAGGTFLLPYVARKTIMGRNPHSL